MTTPLSAVIALHSFLVVSWGERGLCWYSKNASDIIGNSLILTSVSNASSSYHDLGEEDDLKYMTNEEIIVELLIVVDKALGDVFHHDRQAILNYYTVYFWDVNLRYKTIPGMKLSFRIVEVLVIKYSENQPFIDEIKGSDNKINYEEAFGRFNQWLYTQAHELPKFDVAALMTISEDTEGGLGFGWIGGACEPNKNGVIIHDDGTWSNVTVGAHEIGHALGAPHDNENGDHSIKCPTNPDTIMASGDIETRKKRWFFSPCSSRMISEYVRSSDGSCTRRTNYYGQLAISPGFSHVKAPSMVEQCKKLTGNHAAYVRQADTGNCTALKCVVPFHGGGAQTYEYYSEPDNTRCHDGGRCFRGRCRKSGHIIMNTANGKCISRRNKFESSGVLEMTQCPESSIATPLDKFLIMKGHPRGKLLATPFHSIGGTRNDEACIHFQRGISSFLVTRECQISSKWQQWDLRYIGGSNQFWLRHISTNRCAVPDGNRLRLKKCKKFNRKIRWTLLS